MMKNGIGQLQGTPFFIETLQSNDDKRRHQSRCIYFISDNKFCTYRSTKCTGSAHCTVYKEGLNIAGQTDKFWFFDKAKGEYVAVSTGRKVVHNEHGVGVIKDIRPAMDRTIRGFVAEIEFNGDKGHAMSFRVPEAFEKQILKLKKSDNSKRKIQKNTKPTASVNINPAPMIEKSKQPKKKRRKKKDAKKTIT